MRSFLAGLVLFSFLSSGALAQVTGFVESVGIDSRIRPDCWNPLRVNLSSTISEPMQYQLQVLQEDLDKDRVVYTRDITLSPRLQEKFELYFVPQPSLGVDPILAPGVLQKGLNVRVCLPPGEGKRPDDAKVVVEHLGINFSVENIDPKRVEWKSPGSRMILYVTDGSSFPAFNGYRLPTTSGLAEEVIPIPVHPADLGENVLFYDPVDTVIWLSGNADDLEASGSHRKAALDQFVRQGGKLVVCQPADRHKIEALGSMLPVETKDASGNWQITLVEKAAFVDEAKVGPDAPEIDALPMLSRPDLLKSPRYKSNWRRINADGKHPIRIARAKAKPGATVEYWQYWSKSDKSPYIVRGSHGLGCVTWVAQDLGDPNLTGPDSANWPHIWDRVIGWRNNTFTLLDANSAADYDAQKNLRESDGVVDLSKWLLKGTNYASKGAAYVFLAVLFFIGYWVAAGPGSYLLLSRKKRKELNWFIFGAWAVIGTLITILLVRLVLGGDAEVRHLTVVRQAAGEPAYAYSRVGLYVPRDGPESIALEGTATDAISYITPLQAHPDYVENTDFPASQVYGIPLHDDPQPVSIRVPFRSTLKKLQMRWVGDSQMTVSGSAKLIASKSDKGVEDAGVISGTLTNRTGNDLKNVYLVFSYRGRGRRFSRDMVLFIPSWKKDSLLDLNSEYANAKTIRIAAIRTPNTAEPRDGGNTWSIKGPIDGAWDRYWTRWPGESLTGASESRADADFQDPVPKAFPLLSLFDRITPARNESADQHDRVDFLRRGGTFFNMSPAVEAGRLVVLAQSTTDDRPTPFPLRVEGSRVGGEGRVLYQFALPLDRTEMEADAIKGD